MTGLSPRAQKRLPDRDGWAVVTGASSGIGAALSERMAQLGYRVLLTARRRDRLTAQAAVLRERHQVRVDIAVCDLSDRDQRAELCELLRSRRIAILCNNAGFPVCGPVFEADADAQLRLVEVNVVAMQQLVLAVLPGMLRERAGAILVTGANSGEQPVPTAAAYCASRAFANSYAEALAVELTGTGVRCTLVKPGPVRTEFFRVGGAAGLERHGAPLWTSAEQVADAAVAGLARGRRVVVPGLPAKAQTLAGRHLPRWLLFPFLKSTVLPAIRAAVVEQDGATGPAAATSRADRAAE